MTLARPILTSFNGGEISPRMSGRVDTAIYQVALEQCENFVPTVEGPIAKRGGFELIQSAAATASWVTAFRFNLTQDYLIEWSDGKLRFYTNGARIETSPGVAYEVTVPYTAAQARYVSSQQSFDRLYLDHPSHPPARLTRTGALTFTYEVLPLVNGPFADGNVDEAVTVTANATSGAVTLTASSAIFTAGHVGGLFRIQALDFSAIKAWQVGIAGTLIGDLRRSEGKVYTALTAGRTGTVPPIHTSGSEWDGDNTVGAIDVNTKGPYGVQWQYRHDRFGIVKITGFTSSTVVTGTVVRTLPDSVTTTASWRWAHGLFSTAAGWPSVVQKAFGRLIHFKLFDICASVAGDYLNHAAFSDSGLVTADSAFRRTLDAENPVLWAVGDRKLLIGTADREMAIGPVNAAAAVSGDNISADPQSFYGTASVWPLQAGTSTFFVQRGGRKVREGQYNFTPDRYVAENATVWARHITAGGIVQLAFQKEPEELLMAVRGDGQMIVHPHQPEQQVKGWARLRHSDGLGKILSATCIASEDGLRDELWALVERTDTGYRSIERMAAWRDDDDPLTEAFFVDSGLRATATAGQTHFSGLTHLANLPVAVLAAGGVVRDMVCAADGTVDLPASAVPADAPFSVVIGLKYTATAVTLRPEIKLNGESQQGKRQTVKNLLLRVLGTLGIKVGAKGFPAEELFDRPNDADMDGPAPLVNADSGKSIEGGYADGGQGVFISDVPLPATIVCAVARLEIEPPR